MRKYTIAAFVLAGSGLVILGPASFLIEAKAIRSMLGDAYRGSRSDDHLVASMRAKLNATSETLKTLERKARESRRKLETERKVLQTNEERSALLRRELAEADLRLKSAADSFTIGGRTVAREELRHHVATCLQQYESLEEQLPGTRNNLALLEQACDTFEQELLQGRSHHAARVAQLESQVAQLHSSAARVELVKLIGEVRGTARGDSAFDTSFAELDNRVAERNAEADRSLALGNAAHGLWFTGGMASLEDRLSQVLQQDQPSTEPIDAQPVAISE